jgi:hypothetical protein
MGSGAYGMCPLTRYITRHTRAEIFSEVSKQTELSARAMAHRLRARPCPCFPLVIPTAAGVRSTPSFPRKRESSA